jgi:hypothetical protein
VSSKCIGLGTDFLQNACLRVNQFALWCLVNIHSMSQKGQYHDVKSTFFFFNFVKMLECKAT